MGGVTGVTVWNTSGNTEICWGAHYTERSVFESKNAPRFSGGEQLMKEDTLISSQIYFYWLPLVVTDGSRLNRGQTNHGISHAHKLTCTAWNMN